MTDEVYEKQDGFAGFRLPQRALNALDRLAAQRGRNRSEMLRDLIDGAAREVPNPPQERESAL